jgi:hypothetical protein
MLGDSLGSAEGEGCGGDVGLLLLIEGLDDGSELTVGSNDGSKLKVGHKVGLLDVKLVGYALELLDGDSVGTSKSSRPKVASELG